MDVNELITSIREDIISWGQRSYEEIYASPIEEATHHYYQNALKFFAELNEQQRTVFFDILKQDAGRHGGQYAVIYRSKRPFAERKR